MTDIELSPMNFGTEVDYKVALAELRWFKDLKGRLEANDLALIASKYHFPEDFLKKSLKDELSTEDRIIARSRWFPIAYAWAAQRKAMREKLLAAYVAYGRALRKRAIRSVIVIGYGAYALSALVIFRLVDITALTFGIILPYIFFAFSYLRSFWIQVARRKERMDTLVKEAKRNGYGPLVDAANRLFSSKDSFALLVTNYEALEKEIPEITAYQIDKMTVISENPEVSYAERLRSLQASQHAFLNLRRKAKPGINDG